MKLRVNILKKIMMMVLFPIVSICMIVGTISSNAMKIVIVDEIEGQLKIGAYSISQTLSHKTLSEEMNKEIQKLYNYTNLDITIFKGDERIASTIDNAIGTKMDTHIYNELQTGEDYFTTDANINGQLYYGYYIPYFSDKEFIGAVFTGIPQLNGDKIIDNNIIKIIACIVFCGIVSGLIALIFTKQIIASIKGLRTTISTLLENDLSTKHIKYDFEHDELEEISNKTIDFSEHLRQVITKIKMSSVNLKDIASDLERNVKFTNDTCGQISQAIENIASGAISQAEDTTEAANKINNMSEELGRIKINVNELHNISISMNNTKDNALKTLMDLQKVNKVMVNEINSTNNQVNATSKSVEQIQKAVEMIRDIADQTKLLSLNASIEAARAGSHGKGFAVVASEIGKLASESAKSSDEIEEVLKSLVNNYDVIISNVNSTTNNMSEQNNKLSETQSVFTVLEGDIDETVERIKNINHMMEKLDGEIATMVDVVSDLSDISEENSASAEETMASIEELTATISQVYEKAQTVDDSADALMNEIEVFKIK